MAPILIVGGAGNVGGFVARHLLALGFRVRLTQHRTPVPSHIASHPNAEVVSVDLDAPDSLAPAFHEIRAVFYTAGTLFAPNPGAFLPRTNVRYVETAAKAARAAGLRRFLLMSFPQVEGDTTPDRRATGRSDSHPRWIHSRTRMAAERALTEICRGSRMQPVILRTATLYGPGVLMLDAARWLMRRRLLAVWPTPTWYHFMAVSDFVRAVEAALIRPRVSGVYNLGDDEPITIQTFLNLLAGHLRLPGPWRMPFPAIYATAAAVELFATLFHTPAPFTRDFVSLGRVHHAMDTSRMKKDLLPRLLYPTVGAGLATL